MTRKSILEYAAALRPRYLNARKAEKSAILTEFCQTTGYHRKAAIRVLRRTPHPRNAGRRGRPRQYDESLLPHLVAIWEASDRLCSKRPAPFLPELVAALERHAELTLTDAARCQILQLSQATIDRMLAPVRSARGRLPMTQSSASSALKTLVPIRTCDEVGNRIFSLHLVVEFQDTRIWRAIKDFDPTTQRDIDICERCKKLLQRPSDYSWSYSWPIFTSVQS